MNYTDYYKTLGVDKKASEKDIRSAFRKLAKKYHPDTHPGDDVAEKKFKEINEAYEVLGDKEKRARYDQLGANWNQYQNMGGMHGFGGGGRGHRVEFGSQIFDLNFSDFFETFFGEQAGGFWDRHQGGGQQFGGYEDPMAGFRRQPPPQDVTYNAEITLEEALNGTKRRIQQEGKTLEVKIPPGVKDGSKVRVGGKHQSIYLVIHLKAHPQFKVDQKNLKTTLNLMDYEALLGCSKNVKTLSSSVQMKIPAGSSSGQTFRVKGHGLPSLKNPKERGDLYVTLQVNTSKDLSDEERELIEKFQALRQSKG